MKHMGKGYHSGRQKRTRVEHEGERGRTPAGSQCLRDYFCGIGVSMWNDRESTWRALAHQGPDDRSEHQKRSNSKRIELFEALVWRTDISWDCTYTA